MVRAVMVFFHTVSLQEMYFKRSAVIGSLVLLFLISSYSTVYSAEPIRIAMTLGLTGKYAGPSEVQRRGYRLWEKDVNTRGGILNRKVVLTIHDDQSDPQKALEKYRDFILKDKVDFVFAPFSSQITAAVMPFLEEHQYSVLAAGASASSLFDQGYKSIFGMFTPASEFPASFLEMIVMHDLDRVVILHEDDLFSQNLAKGSQKWANRFDLDVLLYEKVPPKDDSLDEILLKAKDSKAQVLIYCGFMEGAIRMRFHLQRMGWYPPAFYAPVGPGMADFKERLQGLEERVFSSSQWEYHGELSPAGTKEFIEAYEKEYHEFPSYFAVTAFSAGQIMEAAIKRAGSIARDQVRDSLSGLETTSLVGRYNVDRTGRQVKNFTLVNQVQNGSQVVVWPKNMSRAKPIF